MSLDCYISLTQDWRSILKPIWDKHKYHIERFLREEKERYGDRVFIVPYDPLIFRAFQLCPFNNLKVVILATEPYPDPTFADGLAYSMPNHHRDKTPSLLQISRELQLEYGYWRERKSLEDWAQQGVLLLNTALTAREYCNNSHVNLWQGFINDVLAILGKKRHIVFMLWGSNVQSYRRLIDGRRNLILTHHNPTHPNWLGNDHFKKANMYLRTRTSTIQWL